VYVLTELGRKYLASMDIPARSLPRSTLRATLESSSMPHTLAVNDALIAVTQLPRQDAAWAVATLLHDVHFKKQPFLVNGKKVIPDGWVTLHYRTAEGTARFCFALEVQHRGHLTTAGIQQKVRSYVALTDQGVHRTYFGDPRLPMTVLFLATRGSEQAESIKRALEAALTDTRQYAAMFYVAPFTHELVENTIVYLEPVWQRPFSQEHKPLFSWL
jgi:hypothetical protein